MPDKLILNPYASLAFEGGTDSDCVLAVPKPGEGLQILNIRRSENSRLHALFLELSQAQLSMLDVENDLDNADRDLLKRYGVLITPENSPQKPLFSCPLDDLTATEFDWHRSNLVVNPSFRFEPFNLAHFRNLMAEKHFSPYLPTAWVKSPGSDIDNGYWLSHAQAETVGQLLPNEKLGTGIDHGLVAKLAAAKILVDPRSFEKEVSDRTAEIDRAREDFLREKYAVLRDVLPPHQVRALQVFYRSYTEQGFMKLGDPLVIRRFREPDEPLARFFHHSFTGLMSKLVGQEVKPSYCYAAAYIEGADLKPHIDRAMCEFSFSVQIDFQPEDRVSPWPIFLSTQPLEEDKKYSLEWSDFLPGAETEKSILWIMVTVLLTGDASWLTIGASCLKDISQLHCFSTMFRWISTGS